MSATWRQHLLLSCRIRELSRHSLFLPGHTQIIVGLILNALRFAARRASTPPREARVGDPGPAAQGGIFTVAFTARTDAWEESSLRNDDENSNLERIDGGKMNLELIANEENQYRAQCGEYEASGMESCVRRARKHVANAAAHNRSNDAEHDRPEHRHMHVHYRFRDKARDQPDKNIPDQVKHTLSSSSCLQNSVEYNPGFSKAFLMSAVRQDSARQSWVWFLY
jgi:hypothetical protein